jgi:SPP1 family predicted phage head-tail adaptor
MPLRGLSARVSVAGRMVGPSAMNRWVTFCTPGQRNADGSGGSTSQPSAAFSCWAAIYALAGEELDKAQQIAQKVSHIVVINYQLGVQANMVIQYIDGGVTRTFQIADITDPDEQRWQLKIFCFEMGTNAGGSS